MYGFANGGAGKFCEILGQVADLTALLEADIAAFPVLLASDHAQQGGFSAAVGADKADADIRGHKGSSFFEDDARAVAFVKIGNLKHRVNHSVGGQGQRALWRGARETKEQRNCGISLQGSDSRLNSGALAVASSIQPV